jgi:DNA primase small subunit
MINTKPTEKSISIVKSAFREYYFKHSKNIEAPLLIEEREFGYMQFGAGMVRHIAFRNVGEILAVLVKDIPSDVYCSNAYYVFPSYPMQEKQWKGADLIFDIDSKDLCLSCEPTHSYFICINCGKISESKSEICLSCNTRKINRTSIPCNKCIYTLKKEVERLIDLLSGDLGIKEDAIQIYFSGNNGFHVHISDTEFHKLGSQARADIVGYLMGNSVMVESIGVRKGPGGFFIKFPKSGLAYGWRRRIAYELGISQSSVLKLGKMVQQKGGYDGFRTELIKTVRDLGVRIDPHVTIDIHRVFRMAGTLNSKSGLTKKRCHDLKSFDPLNDACLLGDKEIDTEIKARVKLRLKGQIFNLKKQNTRLPMYAAVYLICKGLASAN